MKNNESTEFINTNTAGEIITDISLRQYMWKELNGTYDKASDDDRVLYYRLGWSIFKKNKRTIKSYLSFLKFVVFYKWLLNFIFFFYSLIPILVMFLVPKLRHAIPTWIEAGLIIYVFFALWAYFSYSLSPKRKNARQTSEFIKFIDPKRKAINLAFFQKMDIKDREKSADFYDSLLNGSDLSVLSDETQNETNRILDKAIQKVIKKMPIPEEKNPYDKTVRLLALDFLLGEPGILNDYINKLCFSSDNQSITKSGIYKIFAIIIGVNNDNLKDVVEHDLYNIRTNKISLKSKNIRKRQLEDVKKLFDDVNLRAFIPKVDQVIQTITIENPPK